MRSAPPASADAFTSTLPGGTLVAIPLFVPLAVNRPRRPLVPAIGYGGRRAPNRANRKADAVAKSFALGVLCLLIAAPAAPPGPKVKQLLSKELKDIPGKEGLMLEVEYPPGGADPVHRHDAHAFVYVLEGTVVMQVKGGDSVTLKAGETFYEGPDDVHVVGRNASQTEPAKFAVFLVKEKDAPALVPVE